MALFNRSSLFVHINKAGGGTVVEARSPMTGNTPMVSAASSPFSTSSRIVVKIAWAKDGLDPGTARGRGGCGVDNDGAARK